MKTEPIKSQEEANEVAHSLVAQISSRFNISRDEANKRLKGLYKSGFLDNGSPDDPSTQMLIDSFLSVPSEAYAHLK